MKKIWLVALAALGLLVLASLFIPTLNQSKSTAEKARQQDLAFVRSQAESQPATEQLYDNRSQALSLTQSIDVKAAQAKSADSAKTSHARFALASGVVYASDQMVVRSAKLDLITRDVRTSVDQVRTATEHFGGFLEKADLADDGNGTTAAELIVRVPRNQLDASLAAFKGAAVRVENESLQAQDVTREWVDTQARLRNFHAEEEQYLTILKRAAKVQDTLDVADKLSEVRGEIERLQADLNYLSHQVEMSAVTIQVKQQSAVVVAGWHPGENAREAWRTVVSGLTAFADGVVTLVIMLPLVLLWTVSLGGLTWLVWRIWLFLGKRLEPARVTARE